MNIIDNPEHWRKRAEEMRAIADGMTDPETKRIMHSVAASYDLLAKRAEERLAKEK